MARWRGMKRGRSTSAVIKRGRSTSAVVIAVVASAIALPSTAHAESTSESCLQVDELTRFSGDRAIVLEFPRFDPSQGRLTAAVVTTRIRARWDDVGEINSNPLGNPYAISATRTATATVEFPDVAPTQTVTAAGGYTVDDLFSEGSIEEPIGTDAGGNDVPNDDGFHRVGRSEPAELTTNVTDLAEVIGTGVVTALVSGEGTSTFAGADNAVLVPSTYVMGEVCISYSFNPLVSIGDYTWIDVDRDGVQDPAEPPLGGVAVTVSDAGTEVASTTTSAAGAYGITDLLRDHGYTVTFDPPTGYSPTTADGGGDDALDSDPGAAGAVELTTPATGDNRAVPADDPTIDAGFVAYDLALSKRLVSSGPFVQGGTVEYRLVPSNLGPTDALAGWSVTDVLSSHVSLVSMTGPGYSCAALTCTSGAPLPAGESAAPITVVVRLDDADVADIRNVAYVSPAPDDVEELIPLVIPTLTTDTAASPTNNDAEAVFRPSLYDLALVKTVDAPTNDGTRLSIFTVRILNQGTVASGPITVTDHLPDGVVVSHASDGGVAANGTLTWQVADIAPGAIVELTLALELTGGPGTYVNTAEISADSGSTYGGDDDSTPDTDADNDVLVDQTELPTVQYNDPTLDEDDHDIAAVSLSVTPTIVPPEAQPPTLTLPPTGSNPSSLPWWALGAVLAGAAMVAATRRRTPAGA